MNKKTIEIAEKRMPVAWATDEEVAEAVRYFAEKYNMGSGASAFASCVYNLGLLAGKREEREGRKRKDGPSDLSRERSRLCTLAYSTEDPEKIRCAAVFLEAATR